MTKCPLCGVKVTPEFVRTLELLFEAFGLVEQKEPEDRLRAGFVRFMGRGVVEDEAKT